MERTGGRIVPYEVTLCSTSIKLCTLTSSGSDPFAVPNDAN